MKIRSRGLGRRELEMNLREFTVERDGRGLLLKGVTHAPITWETTVRIGPRDIGGIIRLALRPSMVGLVLSWALHRKDQPAPRATEERLGRVTARERPGPGVPEAGSDLDGERARPRLVRRASPDPPQASTVTGAEGH